jgi:hypothetical protein
MLNWVLMSLALPALCWLSVYDLRHLSAASQDRPVVKCEIWIPSTQPSESQTSLLHVLIQNTTPHDAIIKGIEVRLTGKTIPDGNVLGGSQGSYWAWVDPETKSALKTSFDPKRGLTYPAKKLTLPAGKKLDFSLDLRQLRWTNELSSALPPSATLQAIVPQGSYEVIVNLNGEWNEGQLSVESNKVLLEIRKQPKKAQ